MWRNLGLIYAAFQITSKNSSIICNLAYVIFGRIYVLCYTNLTGTVL